MGGPEHMPLPPGRLVAGRYRIQHLLGRGGMGAVYAANDEMLSRQVALKVLATSYALDQELVMRFQREAQAAASISHPGVVQVYDRGADDGVLFAVMELLEGEDLDMRLWRKKRLSPAFVARIGADLCAAIHAAHKVGVIHRDLKPSNVFLAETTDRVDIIKVLDFGVAKIRMPEGASLTRSNQVFGTVAYMAPEQLEAARNAEPRSDLYAVGCILYEMLSGKRAFDAPGAVDLTLQVLERDPPALASLRGDVPQTLTDAISKAMRKKADDRYASAGAFGDALYAVAEQYGETTAPLREPGPPSLRPPSGNGRPPSRSSDSPTFAPSDPEQLAPATPPGRERTEPAYFPPTPPVPTEMTDPLPPPSQPDTGSGRGWIGIALGVAALTGAVAWYALH